MALSCNPKLLLADEPTTALDVTIQAQVMEQIVNLQQELGTAVVLVTHDLGVVAESCQRALVMYAGRIVEQSPIIPLFQNPQHPYSAGLMASIPRIRAEKVAELPTIPGTVPDLLHLPDGCRFAERCQYSDDRCHQVQPIIQMKDNREVACFHPCGEIS
jgi:oligopeptide/dipeptide ABC transporter ATP-binding protein